MGRQALGRIGKRFTIAKDPGATHFATIDFRREIPLTFRNPVPYIDPRGDEKWYALVIAPAMEAKVSRHLRKMYGFQTYHPVKHGWRNSMIGHNKVRREYALPFMPGYLFVCVPDQMTLPRGDLRSWFAIKETDGVLGWIANYGAPLAMPVAWLARVAAAESAGAFEEEPREEPVVAIPEPPPEIDEPVEAPPAAAFSGPFYKRGEPITIKASAFAGHEAVVHTDNVDAEVKLLVRFLGGTVSTTLPVSAIAPHVLVEGIKSSAR